MPSATCPPHAGVSRRRFLNGSGVAIALPKRLQGFLADRPKAVAAVTRIFLDEIEKLLCHERLRCDEGRIARSMPLSQP